MPNVILSKKTFVRVVTFVKVGNGPAIRVGKLMKEAGADIGTTAKAYCVKGGIYLAISKPSKAKRPAAKPQFKQVDRETFLASFANSDVRLKQVYHPSGRELP